MKKIALFSIIAFLLLFLQGSVNADITKNTEGFDYSVVCEPCDPVVFPCDYDFLGGIGLTCSYVQIEEGAPKIENPPLITSAGYHSFSCQGCDPVVFPCDYDFLGGIGLVCTFQ